MNKLTGPYYECFDARDAALTKMVLKNMGVKFTEVDGTHMPGDKANIRFYVQEMDQQFAAKKEELLDQIYQDDSGEMNDKVSRQFNQDCRTYSTKFRQQ